DGEIAVAAFGHDLGQDPTDLLSDEAELAAFGKLVVAELVALPVKGHALELLYFVECSGEWFDVVLEPGIRASQDSAGGLHGAIDMQLLAWRDRADSDIARIAYEHIVRRRTSRRARVGRGAEEIGAARRVSDAEPLPGGVGAPGDRRRILQLDR